MTQEKKPTTATTVAFRLDVLVRAGDGVFVGQCLQYDITVQAPTLDQMKERFAHAFAFHFVSDAEAGKPPLSSLRQAPRRFWDIYLRGGNIAARDVPIYVPSVRQESVDARATFVQVLEAA